MMQKKGGEAESAARDRMRKLNCWEHMRCGREPGGRNEAELGTCPSATEARFDGYHGGRNAGRACWVVAGTMCGGEVQGTFAKKCAYCIDCDFYKMVNDEEGGSIIQPRVLLNILGQYKGLFPADME